LIDFFKKVSGTGRFHIPSGPPLYSIKNDPQHSCCCRDWRPSPCVDRHVENTLRVLDYLKNDKKVRSISHPSFPDQPTHAIYNRYFPNGAGSIFTFDIDGTEEDAKKFIDSLEPFSLLANVADVKSLVIHPASTTHSQLNEAELKEQGISPSTIRLSIGTEHINDIIADLDQAFAKIRTNQKEESKEEKKGFLGKIFGKKE